MVSYLRAGHYGQFLRREIPRGSVFLPGVVLYELQAGATTRYDRADVETLRRALGQKIVGTAPDDWLLAGRCLAQRCALLNGRDPSERRSISERLKALYDRRSRLGHGDFIKTRFRELPKEDRILATNMVRVSLLTLIALGRAKKEVLGSLDRAIFDPGKADQLRAEGERYWATREVDIENLFAAEGAP